MAFYGVDAHSDNFKIEKISENNKNETMTICNNKKELDSFISKLQKEDFIAVEASTNSFWFYDLVKSHAKECYIINTWKFADIRNSFIKTDKRDAKKLAKHLKYSVLFGNEDEQLPLVYVPENEVREIRSLFTTYEIYKKKKVMSKNRVHSLLKQQGISYKTSKEIFCIGLEWVLDQNLSEITIFQIQLLINEISYLEKNMNIIKDKILEKGKIFKKEINLLTSIKGISIFNAIAIMSDIVNIKRFKSSKKLCSYLGLAPKIASSNKTLRIGCINRQSRKLTRTLFSQSVIHFYNSSDYYKEFTTRIKKRKSAGKSRIAVMRKIVTNIYRMLNDNTLFYGRNEINHNRKLKEYNNFLKRIA